MRTLLRLLTVLAAFVAALALVGGASAASRADYAFDGGTASQRAQVKAALRASSFDWSTIATRVTVHVVRGVLPHSTPGQVWLDPDLLDSGRFAWAVVQDEFAHQVDFFHLTDASRQTLDEALGTHVWCHGDDPGLDHSAYGCERFTSMLVWAYWQSADNAYRPTSAGDESATLDPARFRTVLASVLAAQSAPAAAPSVPAVA